MVFESPGRAVSSGFFGFTNARTCVVCLLLIMLQNVLMSYATDSWTAYFRVMRGMNSFSDVLNSCT